MEHRPGEVGVDPEDRRSEEQRQEAVEDEEVTEPGDAVTPLDPLVGEDDPCHRRQPADELGDGERPAGPAGAVLRHEAHDAPGEDCCRHDDEAVPQYDLG